MPRVATLLGICTEDSHPMQYLGHCTGCNSSNINHWFNPMVVKDCHVIDPCLIIFFLHFLLLHFSFSFAFSFRFTKFQKISLFHQTLPYVGHWRQISMIMATNGSFWGPHDHHQWCLPARPSPLPTSPCFLILSSPAVAKLLVAPSPAVLLSGITSVGGYRVLIFSLIYFLFYFFFVCLFIYIYIYIYSFD